MSFVLSLLLAGASDASAASCYGSATYGSARADLADLPTGRDRDAIPDRDLQAAFDDLEIALVLFLATEGTTCRTAEPAMIEVEYATNLVAAAAAGFYCSCEDAIPISGFDCDSCDYHPTWGCQCWFKKKADIPA